MTARTPKRSATISVRHRTLRRERIRTKLSSPRHVYPGRRPHGGPSRLPPTVPQRSVVTKYYRNDRTFKKKNEKTTPRDRLSSRSYTVIVPPGKKRKPIVPVSNYRPCISEKPIGLNAVYARRLSRFRRVVYNNNRRRFISALIKPIGAFDEREDTRLLRPSVGRET